ncbi:short-chain dehydrogenase [Exophiala viscosa]|uniref:Short-chain dehydrogenase n=1 Tax=Exophiala viscosa TaxID=2486360 RepID=A0AAN6DTC0_9EURO|nr:short-chain dehydrogenase [Exophiala viscosa]KAI1622924.1 short-chain dehydrogenase [Exophiala viscosa]
MSKSTLDLIDTAVITGGAGGIGRAMAECLIKHGKKVIIAGRTESNLKKTSEEIGATAYYVLDTGKTDMVAEVSKKIIAEHPEVNCLVNNAGVQRPFQFPGVQEDQDYSFDLSKADQEIDINIRGPMHLTVLFLPHLLEKKGGIVINVSSVLGFLPSSVINPVYNGTKAWVHFFTLNLRTQYAGKVKVVEIAPPTVSTALHRERTDPNDNSKEKNQSALTLEEFITEVEAGWKEGKDLIAPGPAGAVVSTWQEVLGQKYENATAS